jgi:cytochrome c oxidase accessory protein FixG
MKGCAVNKRPLKIRSLRWAAEILQAVVIIGLPFLKIRGESALRFDIPSLRLHVFGHTIWMQEFFIVLATVIFFALLFVFITLVFGRIWCGWLCPQTVLTDFTPFVDRAGKKGFMYKFMAFSLTFLLSIVVAATSIWYFVSPYEFIPDFINGNLGSTTWGFWIVMTVIIFLNYAFLRHKWCATVCPYAKLQGALFDNSTLIIELDPKRACECINCRKCEKVCPTGINIRDGLSAACIYCAECLDACNEAMSQQGKNGLIRYAFGAAGEGRIFRQNFFTVGAFVLVFFVFSAYLMLARTGIDFAVLMHSMEPRIIGDGSIINAYVLSVKNMRSEPVDLQVSVERLNNKVWQSINEPIYLEAGETEKMPLFVGINERSDIKGMGRIKIRLKDEGKNINLAREANFRVPDDL